MTHEAKPYEYTALMAMYQSKIRKIQTTRIKLAKLKKDSHPKYKAMTDEEFKAHKIATLRLWVDKEQKVRDEMKHFEKTHIVYE